MAQWHSERVSDNGHLVVVGDDYREDLSPLASAQSGVPIEVLPVFVDVLFASVSNDVYVLDTEIQSISAIEAYQLGMAGSQVVVEGNIETEN